NSLIIEIISKTGEIYDLRKIKAGNNYLINYDADGFQSFRYDIEKNKYLELFRVGSGRVEGKIVVIPYEIRIELIEGSINGSLYETLTNSEKGGGELAEHLATLYEYDIDFNRDIRKGDSFLILLEKRYLNGAFSGYGKIIASEFINRGKKTSVVRFAADPGKNSYYHPDGRAVKKMFLRCPLPFMRLTSRFGYRRHPVTGFSAAHNGIDLGAPRGTTVRATADGRIYQAGYDRVRGRYIVMSHGNKYRTHYYHLSGIKKGIRRGKWVTQGNVIGYVGNTGRSTGPHLHYGLQRSGRYLNPLRLNSPSREPVKKKDRERFDNSSGVIFTLVKIGKSNILSNKLKQFIYRSALEIIGNNI
ncbi:MAG: peptidoglycan DD-metalloendopeptidase family protein, partial [Candidatus Aminicenantes bacterium]|nr:peptidoglycan DD-metalloendopeptidase family protein [Candidatus Aminicenantes bacterium]